MSKDAAIVFITGPTASGKTDLAYELAERDLREGRPAGIMNSDSLQVYKELNIGSAKPDFTKRPSVPCYLFDEASAPQVWTAGLFRKRALEILKKEAPRRRIYITGGSGFYIQALEKGMHPVKALSAESLRHWERKEKELGLEGLYDLLLKKDPERARQISSKDKYRIIRSLSLIESEGKKASQIKKEFKEQALPWRSLKAGLNPSKEELLRRARERAEKMLKQGLIEEAAALVKKGFRGWRPLGGVGYKEALLYLDGKIKKEELLPSIVSGTMALAKKQKTWFKKDKSIQWLDPGLPPLKAWDKAFPQEALRLSENNSGKPAPF